MLIVIIFIQFVWLHALIIRLGGDIETNPGPKPNPCHNFSICHWNLNNLTAHNYLKVSLLPTYIHTFTGIRYGGKIPFVLHPKTDKSLSNIAFTEKDTEKVIQNLD